LSLADYRSNLTNAAILLIIKCDAMKKQNATKSDWFAFARADGTFDFEALTPEQKEKFYNECQTIQPSDAKPLSRAQRRLHAKARRPGRPRKGHGTKIISLSIEKDLLRRAEKLAKAQGLSRSDVFSRGLRALLALAGAA
jgi:hypothetical protein